MSQIGYERHRAERRAAARFEAKYPGRCVNCESDIEVGDTLRWDDDAAVHADCDANPLRPALEVCPKCWIEIALNSECGCEA